MQYFLIISQTLLPTAQKSILSQQTIFKTLAHILYLVHKPSDASFKI